MVRYAFLLLAAGIIFLAACTASPNQPVAECVTDTDCVPTGCCHPDSCVAAVNAPDCRDTFCTQECRPGSLDCGAGSCSCIEGKCGVRWNG